MAEAEQIPRRRFQSWKLSRVGPTPSDISEEGQLLDRGHASGLRLSTRGLISGQEGSGSASVSSQISGARRVYPPKIFFSTRSRVHRFDSERVAQSHGSFWYVQIQNLHSAHCLVVFSIPLPLALAAIRCGWVHVASVLCEACPYACNIMHAHHLVLCP